MGDNKKGKKPGALEQTVEQLAMQTMMVEADDVMALGSILENLEKLSLEDEKAPPGPERGLLSYPPRAGVLRFASSKGTQFAGLADIYWP